ncbi:MAG: LPS-assembly protein LptD [Methyloligellaceae bacterium]
MRVIEMISIWLAGAVAARMRRALGIPAGVALIAAALCLVVAPMDGARAQSGFTLGGGKGQSNPDQPMLLQADEMIYNNQNNTVTAKGNVEIYHGTYTLLAEKVIYDQGAQTLTAEGNVRIKEPDGAIINADRITLTDDFRDGFIRQLKIVTKEDARIAAARGIREDEETTVFEKAVFTPCKVCEDKPEKPPTWAIKATRVIHKKSEATISYENAKLEFMGVPIAWMPFFKHADPSVKRKSGFLIPKFGQSDDLGFFTEVPYYFALSPHYDFTFSPTVYEKRGVLLKGKWRHRTKNGRYSIDVAGIAETDSPSFIDAFDVAVKGGDDFRGSIQSKGEFAINQHWDWGWDVTAESDDTFRRFYKLDNIVQTERVSEVYLVGQGDRSYFDARLFHFGGLSFTDTSNAESQVLPVIDYNYIFKDPVWGGELSFNSNVVSLTRDDGADSHHLISEVKWRRQFIDRRGQVITPFASGRGDVYQVSNVVDPITFEDRGEDQIFRGTAAVGTEYRYPFAAHTERASHVIEPIAQIIARPGLKNQEDIPNEDARSLVFDDTLLFDLDKFSGYDRIETGTRANVGLRYTLQRYKGGTVRAVVGQSYQVAGDNEFRDESGLETTQSDYVTGLYIEPIKYFTFVGQARFDEDSLDLRRTDLYANASVGPVSSTVSYANLKAQPGLGILEDRSEVIASANVLVTEHWSAFGNVRYDIQGDQRISDSLGVRWADDCFALSVTYTESFVRDRDIEPNETVFVRFEFKHLGAYDIDAGGLVAPDS